MFCGHTVFIAQHLYLGDVVSPVTIHDMLSSHPQDDYKMLSEKCDTYKVERDRMCEEKENLLAKLDQLKKKIETLEVRLLHIPSHIVVSGRVDPYIFIYRPFYYSALCFCVCVVCAHDSLMYCLHVHCHTLGRIRCVS